MTWWASNEAEPKRSNRWNAYISLFDVQNIDFGPKYYTVSSFDKPTFKLDSEKIINNFTSETTITTKNYTWEDISITMIDGEGLENNNSKELFYWLRSLGYEPVQTIDGMSSLFTNIYNQKMAITLTQLDADGLPIESWKFLKPQPTRIQFGGTLDYESTDIMKVTMDITYVSAVLEDLTTIV